MKLFLCPNGFTDAQTEQAVHCVSVLEDQCGHCCSLLIEDSKRLFDNDHHSRFSPADSDMIVSLGGDGSVLRAAQIAIQYEKPLLGINSGRLGFLCAVEFENIARFNETLELCRISKRTLLEFVYNQKVHYAVNDIVIARNSLGTTVDLSVRIQQSEPFSLRGDGLILSTPTGSTAYTLSAGGAIIEPDMPVWELTPICPHGMNLPPRVIDDKKRVTISERNNLAEIIADGTTAGRLHAPLEIYKSKRSLLLYVKAA